MSAERIRVIHGASAATAPPPPGGIERRGAPRFQTRTAGIIYPGNAYASLPCVITDISATGARLAILDGWFNPYKEPHGVGQEFRLVMRIDRLEVPCAIVRIEGNVMGVRFVKAAQPIPKAPQLIRSKSRGR